MTDSPIVGSASWELRATRDKLKADLRDSEADVKKSVGAMEREAGAGADRIGGSFGRMGKSIGIGIAAVVAAAAAGLAIAVQFGQASLKMADDIANASRRIGISTNALQEFQYVARKTGEDVNAVSGALETFANKLDGAASGLSKGDIKLFRSIGLEPGDLRAFKDTETALDEVIDRIGALKSEADRSAISEKLGLGPLVTALSEGSAEVARLRDEAQALGFTLDEELIRKGSEAQGQLEDLSQVIGIQMAGAFIGLSDEILAFTATIAGAISKLSEFIDTYQRWKGNADTIFGNGFTKDAISGLTNPFTYARNVYRVATNTASGQVMRNGLALANPQDDEDDPALLRQRMAAEAYNTRPTRRRPSYNSELTIPPGRTRTDNSAQRAAEREARRSERVEQEIFRARQRLLQVAEDDILTAQQRYDLAREQLKMDREARDAEIQSKTDRGEIKAAERRRLDAANAEADALEDRLLADNAFRALEDERIANEKILSGLTVDLLSLRSGAAKTSAERRDIELELLAITQRERREALILEANRKGWSKERLDGALKTLDSIDQGERSQARRNTMSPLEAWRDRSLTDAKQIEEAYERIAANGLDALNDGLVDAIMNSRSLGEVFSNVARQILADLAAIAVRKSITEPLANALFDGSGSGSGGGIGASIFSAVKSVLKLPSFASGVTNFAGGLAEVHAGELLVNLPQGTDVIPAHAVQAMGSKGSVSRVVVTTNDDRFNAYVDDRAARPAAAAFSTARKAVPSDMARTDRYTLGRRR